MHSNQYYEIYPLVALVDEHLERGTRHFYTLSGQLLTTFDQIILAILTNTLAPPPHALPPLFHAPRPSPHAPRGEAI